MSIHKQLRQLYGTNQSSIPITIAYGAPTMASVPNFGSGLLSASGYQPQAPINTEDPETWAEKIVNGEQPDWRNDQNAAYNYDNLRALLNKLVERNIDLQNRLSAIEASIYPDPTPSVVENTKRALRRG